MTKRMRVTASRPAGTQKRAVPDDDLSRVREGIRAFLIASARRPELVRLMNQEGLHSTRRLDYIMTSFTLPTLTPLWQALNRLADAGILRHVPARTLLFLIAHGAAAPFTLGPLSDRFNPVDGPLGGWCFTRLTIFHLQISRFPGG